MKIRRYRTWQKTVDRTLGFPVLEKSWCHYHKERTSPEQVAAPARGSFSSAHTVLVLLPTPGFQIIIYVDPFNMFLLSSLPTPCMEHVDFMITKTFLSEGTSASNERSHYFSSFLYSLQESDGNTGNLYFRAHCG